MVAQKDTPVSTMPLPPSNRQIGKSPDPFELLEGEDRDAYAALVALFTSYGLASLAPEILKMIQEGFGSDTITLKLQETDAYKQRFAANEARRKKGLPVLSPGDYLALEGQYRQVLSAAGLPIGFYDNVNDFRSFLENDMSPTELQARADAAREAVYESPERTRAIFEGWYSEGDLVAMALDPSVAMPLIQQRIKAAEAAAFTSQAGVNIGRETAEEIGRTGATVSALRQGAEFIGYEFDNAAKLAAISDEDYSADELASEVFLGDAEATRKRNRLASRERARFKGSGGQGNTSLSTSASGKI